MQLLGKRKKKLNVAAINLFNFNVPCLITPYVKLS